MMLRYKQSRRYATRSNLRQGKATIIDVDFESRIPTALSNINSNNNHDKKMSATPSVPHNTMTTRLATRRRVSLGGSVTVSFAPDERKTVTNHNSPAANMIFEADDVSMGSISTHSSVFDATAGDDANKSPTMMVSPMPKADPHSSQTNAGVDKFGIPKTLPTATAATNMASSNTVVTPPKRISLGGMSSGSTLTVTSHNNAAVASPNSHPTGASVSVSRDGHPSCVNVSPINVATPILDQAALSQLVMKTPVVEAATTLLSLLYTTESVMEDARPQAPQPFPTVAIQPLDLSKGLDQDVPLPGNLPALLQDSPALAETSDDDDNYDAIDEEVAFYSQRRNSINTPSMHRPSVKKTLKKKKKVAVKAKKSPIKKPPIKKSTSKPGYDPSCYKRIPQKFLSNPTILMDGMRLAAKGDKDNLNQLHCFVRKELLEVFVLDGSEDGQHRVGLRCVHCGCLPKNQRSGSSMSAFFPKSVEDLYRAVCTWQRIHFKACQVIPEDVKDTYWRLKEDDRTRGKKAHWVKSAKNMGFRNLDNDRSGVVWCQSVAPEPNFDDSEDEEEEVLL